MTAALLDQVRRLDSAERRWLAEAQDRLRRTRRVRGAVATRKEQDR